MKSIFTVSIALLAAVANALPTSPVPETDASIALQQLESRATTCTNAATDKLIFKVSMKTFQSARKSKNPSKCVWASDNCSKSPDKPAGFNFIPSCQRHDFGYRNTKKQKRFTKAMKKRIDDNFKKDLYKYCSGQGGLKGVACRRLADTYYNAVRKFGKRDEELEFDPESEYTKREQPVDKFESFDGSELDADIAGQVIPEVIAGDGVDVDDLDEFLSE